VTYPPVGAPVHAFVDSGVYHLEVVGRLPPSMNGNHEFTPREPGRAVALGLVLELT
jgi:hypothetical protein